MCFHVQHLFNICTTLEVFLRFYKYISTSNQLCQRLFYSHCRSSVLGPRASLLFHHTCSFIKILYLFACTTGRKGTETAEPAFAHLLPISRRRISHFDLELRHTAEPTQLSWLLRPPSDCFNIPLRYEKRTLGFCVCGHLSDAFAFYYVLLFFSGRFWLAVICSSLRDQAHSLKKEAPNL